MTIYLELPIFENHVQNELTCSTLVVDVNGLPDHSANLITNVFEHTCEVCEIDFETYEFLVFRSEMCEEGRFHMAHVH